MQTHFTDRCRERGITETDALALQWRVRTAIEMEDWDFVDKVMTDKDGSTIWRFEVPEGVFYTVTHAGSTYPKTLLTHAMVRKKKKGAKTREKKAKRRYAYERRSGKREERREGDKWSKTALLEAAHARTE